MPTVVNQLAIERKHTGPHYVRLRDVRVGDREVTIYQCLHCSNEIYGQGVGPHILTHLA